MLFWTHLLFGLFFGFMFFETFSFSFIFLIFVLIGSIILDIDNFNSKIGHFGISRVFMSFFNHRGFVHSFIFIFLTTFILYLLFGLVSLGFLIGGISHLFLDSLTIRGIKPFFPSKKRFRGFLKSGGFIEKIIFLLFLIIDVFFMVYYLNFHFS